jgi:hypothetical protein
MSKIIINKTSSYNANIPSVRSISFDHMGSKVYSATKIQGMFGVFVSQPIQGESNLLTWKDVSWVAQKYEGTDVFVYVKSASTISELEITNWSGPYLNNANDISDMKGLYLQFMVVLANYGIVNTSYESIVYSASPVFQSIQLTYLSSSSASRFYTTAFSLGFVPKHILLAYNGSIPTDAYLRFAVSGFDSVNTNDYQYILPNKIEELSELSMLSTQFKLMIEMVGSSSTPITIHEVALMFSGDQQLVINDMSSSSSSSSSNSS